MDVVNINNLSDLDSAIKPGTTAPVASAPEKSNTFIPAELPDIPEVNEPANNGKMRIIGFKNITNHAGATSLIYMLTKTLKEYRKVAAIEVNKVDFLYFNDPEHMVSSTSQDLLKEIMHRNDCDIILLDLNDYEDEEICTEMFYLIEPSTIMINKMLKRGKNILETLQNKNIILNKCVLNSEDIATFGYETKLKVVFSIPALDDRQDNIEPIKKFIAKINL